MANNLLPSSSSKKEIQDSIVRTICYSDIFDYPLNFEELHYYLISKKITRKKELKKIIEKKIDLIGEKDGYFFLKNREDIVKKRRLRALESERKIKKAERIAESLSLIPTIKLIGLSGSLSMNNSKKTDDIDFFIITRNNTLWMTRFLVFVFLSILGVRRKRGSIKAEGKICPNMFLSEDNLSLKDRNLFLAHEVVQLKVLIDKDDTYKKFKTVNKWVLDFLPNFEIEDLINMNLPGLTSRISSSLVHSITRFTSDSKVGILCSRIKSEKKLTISNFLISKLERLFFLSQLFYMRKHKTIEKVDKDIAKFHPVNGEKRIFELYKKRCNYFGVKDDFWLTGKII